MTARPEVLERPNRICACAPRERMPYDADGTVCWRCGGELIPAMPRTEVGRVRPVPLLLALAAAVALYLNGFVFVPHRVHHVEAVRTVPTTAEVTSTTTSSTTTSSTTTTAAPPTTRPAAAPSRPTPPAVRGSAAGGSAVATWYDEGCCTASGERFNPDALTFASRTMAFGTRVRFCHDGRCVVARCNDRGPFVGGVSFDLSRATFGSISPLGAGHVPVTWEVV